MQFQGSSPKCFIIWPVLTISKDLGCTTLDFILAEIVKPYHFLAYENRLALAIKRHGSPYLKDAAIKVGNSPDYNSNRDLFRRECSLL